MAGGSRRFEFGWLEVLGLILVFAGGSVVVFFLGVFVGKGLQESRLAREERVVRLPIDPVAAAAPGRGAARPRPATGVAPAPKAAPGPNPRPTSAFQLAVRPAPSATAAPLGPSPVAATSIPRPTDEAVVARPTPSPEPVRVVAIPTASPRAARSGLMGEARGNWSVQVNATKDAYTARKIVQDLRRRGYNAYAVEVRLRGELWYRVRVGRFPTMQDATAMVVRLKNTERYTRAFLVEE